MTSSSLPSARDALEAAAKYITDNAGGYGSNNGPDIGRVHHPDHGFMSIPEYLLAIAQDLPVGESEGTVEWAVEKRTFRNGPWDEIDDGTRWSNRYGKPYTEEEARAEAGRRVNHMVPESWRRVVTRTVHYGDWEVAPDEVSS